LIIVIAAAYFIMLPKLSGTSGTVTGGAAAVPTPTAAQTTAPVTTTTPPTTVPTPTPETFPDALPLKQWFTFGSGKVES
jgi:cell division septation protein DedD